MKKLRAQILLSTFDGARYLPTLLNSLLSQSCDAWELLVRDDGSRDESVEILRRLGASDSRVRLLVSGPNLKPAMSFAALLDAASGEVPVFFCDQDDIWEPTKIDSFLKEFETSDPDLPLAVFSDLAIVSSNGSPLFPSFFERMRYMTYGFSFEERLVHNTIPGCALAMNCAAVAACRPIPASAIMHDWWCLAILGAVGHLRFVPHSHVNYRQHAEQSSGGVGGFGWIEKARAHFSRDAARTGKNLQQLMLARFRQMAAVETRLTALDANSKHSRELREFLETAKSAPSATAFSFACFEFGLRMQGPLRSAVFFLGTCLYGKEIIADLRRAG